MPVNQTLAQFSDWSYFTAFAFYLLAFMVAIAFYARRASAAELGKNSAERELVSVGAGAVAAGSESSTVASASDSGVVIDGKSAADAKVEKHLSLAHKLGTTAEMLIYVGVAVHFASVLLRGLATQRFPWGNLYEYVSVSLLFSMVVAAGVLHRESMRVFWPWLLAPVLALMFYGGKNLYVEAAPVVPALQSIWIPIHVTIIASGASIALVSGVSSILYLLRMAQPVGKEKGVLGKVVLPLPSAQTLDSIAYRTAIWAFPLFGLGIVLGAIWAEAAWGRYWGWDPKETVSFISWIIYALYLHARATSGWRNSKAAWINIVGFSTMVFNLFFINMVVSGLHSYAGLN
nr:c-type cytochrome biogenesis protein CcsB [Corynebacterium lactis]